MPRFCGSPEYLRHALQQLRRRDSPLVVFGSRLSAEDQHLVDALNEHPTRPVAVSLYPGAKRDVAAIQRDIYARLEADPLLFFDSTTIPWEAPTSARRDDERPPMVVVLLVHPNHMGGSTPGTRYVKQNAEGSWEVLREGDRRAPVHLDTQEEAVRQARAILRAAGGGRVLVMDRDGKVTESNRVARSRRAAGTKRRMSHAA